MIQIDTVADNEELYLKFYYESMEFVRSSLKSCIDQNLILNCYLRDDFNKSITSYFSIDLEHANEFIRVYADARKVWSDNGVNFSVSTKEIDFYTVQSGVFPILNDNDDGCFGDPFIR